jgi:tRNA (guanine-N7-)-methyltransferase
VLEIGFGMGDATARIAAALPGTDFIGVEVHEPGVGALLQRIAEAGLTNLRIVQFDAVQVLEHMVAPASLTGVHVFFPDPWHKKKHNKRRLIQPPLVRLLQSRLAPGGTLHCATDWQPYAEQMLEVLSAEPALRNSLKLGHGVWDLVFVKR